MSKSRISQDFLDSYISTEQKNEEESKPSTAINGNGSQKPAQKRAIKQRLTIQISEDVIERAKNAVYWTRGLTLAQLAEDAIEKAVRALEKNSVVYDDKTGQPLKEKGDEFPKRLEGLTTGRPVK